MLWGKKDCGRLSNGSSKKFKSSFLESVNVASYGKRGFNRCDQTKDLEMRLF